MFPTIGSTGACHGARTTAAPNQRCRLVRRAALVAFLGVQLGDGLLTYAGITRFGWHVEANPLVAWYVLAFGPEAALASAKTFAVACVLPLHWRGMYRTIGVLTAIYLAGALFPWAHLLWP